MESLFTPDALPGSLTSAQCVDKMIEVMHEYDALTTSPQTKGNTKPLGGDALLDGLFHLNVSSNGNMPASLGDLHMQKQRQDALFASATVVGVAAIHAYGSDPGVAKGNPDAGVGKATSQDYAAGGFKTGNTQATSVVEDMGNVDNFIKNNVNTYFQQSVKEAFREDVKVTTLTQNTQVYRYSGGTSNNISYWYTPNQTSNPVADLALPPGNTYQNINTYVIPKGTILLEGTAAPNFGQPGGGYQFYVPDPTVVISR